MKPEINLSDAESFLEEIGSVTGDQEFTFQTFAEGTGSKDSRFSRVINGNFKNCKDQLIALNNEGAGIFVAINQTDLKGRKIENIKKIRAVFVDKDDGALDDNHLEFSLKVKSARGEHGYFLLNDPLFADAEIFSHLQKSAASVYSSDATVKDLCRVMRLPGFLHLKDRKNPVLVRLTKFGGPRYSLEAIFEKLKFKKGKSSKSFEDWVGLLPTREGERNSTMTKIVREGLGSGIPKEQLFEVAYKYIHDSGLPISEGEELLRRHLVQHEKNPFVQLFTSEKLKINFADLADMYLKSSKYCGADNLDIRHYKGDFYYFKGNKYELLPREDLSADIIRFLQKDPLLRSKANGRFCSEIMKNIEGMGHLSSSINAPFWIDSEKEARNFIPFKNGLLNIDDLVRGSSEPLTPHSRIYFCRYVLPFNFDPMADCRIWKEFLEDVIPCLETRNLVQEFFGLCMVYDSSYQKFLILFGDGANGKSVICTVLRALLGEENTSAVSLEAFDPIRTFPLATMDGKLANIVEEVGSFKKSNDSILKQIVSGGEIHVERKNRDGYSMRPTARLIFASNARPVFTDRTNGIWRRMLAIHMKTTVPVEKQKRELTDQKWWEEAGELPGIINWSLEGYSRLRSRGRFLESEEMISEKEEVKLDSNPAREFVLQFCKLELGAETPVGELYRIYDDWCTENKIQYPLSKRDFSMEVTKTLPGVVRSASQRTIGGKRDRLWMNLRCTNNIGCEFDI